MNTDKISKFITKKRKEKKLTQQELANLTHLSEKTISKWECGRGIPDIGNLQSLSKALDVSVTEILNGEEEEKEQPVIEYIEYKEKKTKKKVLITLLLSTLIMLLIVLGTFFINNYGKTKVYLLSGKGEHFRYYDMIVVKSNSGNLVGMGYLEDDHNYEYEDVSIDLYMNDHHYGTIPKNAYIISDKKQGIIIPDNAFAKTNNWKIEVFYILDGEEHTETIELEAKEIVSGNRFTKEKIETFEEKKEKRELSEKEKCEEITEYIKNHNYKIDDHNSIIIASKKFNDKESFEIDINDFEPYRAFLSYRYKDSSITITMFHISLTQKYNKLIFSGTNQGKTYSFRYIINDNKAACIGGNCPDKMEIIGKRYVELVEQEFYKYDIFDRNEECNCYTNVRESDEDV